MEASLRRRTSIALFICTVFVSAFLLFQVQPLMGKYILPWFGGSPNVWSTCMLVFQILLFAGYAYAHLLTRFCSTAQQTLIHCGLLSLAAITLPIAPDASWKPAGNDPPILMIMLLLISKVGLPYFLLSSTGPLLQSWLGRQQLGIQPWRLYALSNVGSLLALISFPFVFEPMLSSREQSSMWSVAFCGFILLCGLTSLSTWNRPSRFTGSASDHHLAGLRSNPTAGQLFSWFALSMIPSVLLLATTNQVCLDTAVIPFLWVIPLAIYLASFILTFDSERWYSRRPYILLCVVSYGGIYLVQQFGPAISLPWQLLAYFSCLFFSCMVCHGELVRLKPAVSALTTYYLTISAGGACGGIFVGLIAPLLFIGYFELQLGMFGCVIVFLALYFESTQTWQQVPNRLKFSAAILLPLIYLVLLTFRTSTSPDQLTATRNFYGVLRVANRVDTSSGELVRTLVHGSIVHGSQFQDPDLKMEPTSYYTRSSGVGLALDRYKRNQGRRIGVVGLGAGTLACYGQAGDQIRFYEINPSVLQLAMKYFTFMSDSAAEVGCELGDARLTLERQPSQQFDLLVLDAFSGDAIPVHLLTREAMQIYRRHLRTDGVIAIHISNQHFDLRPIVAGLASFAGLESIVVCNDVDQSIGALASTWVLLGKDESSLQEIVGDARTLLPTGKPTLWTDERSNLFEVMGRIH